MISHNTLLDMTSLNVHPLCPDLPDLKHASVALLINAGTKDHLLTIVKADSKKDYIWKNQVALPGGHVDETDASPMDAAIREVSEELGIKNFEVLGSIGYFMTLKNRCVQAFAGFYDETEKIIPLDSEISEVLKIPMNHIFDVHLTNNFRGNIPSLEKLIYPYENHMIWGLTARIIHHFLECLCDLSVGVR